MQRRDFLKTTIPSILISSSNLLANDNKEFFKFFTDFWDIKKEEKEIFVEEIIEESTSIDKIAPKDNLLDVKKSILEDVYLENIYLKDFQTVRKKLGLLQRHVGYGNFNIISFDEILNLSKRVSSIGEFSKSELAFMEKIFYYDPNVHGFYGKRVSENITDSINRKNVVKIPQTGHYLFKGEPHDVYYKMKDDVGDSLILTSGVRSIVKQMKLFLDKLHNVEGNLSIASKSLAPPAFTYHSVSDFDVGKKGFGHANFTPRFALTEEFSKISRLKYISMRYTINNKDGVRYEPWHVKVI